MDIGLDRCDSARGQEAIEVIVHPIDIFRMDGVNNSWYMALKKSLVLNHSVFLGNVATGRHTAPVAKESMPDGDILEHWVLFTDRGDC